ncbi:CubicO group peptidase (beta-lactamase class C family) [Pedobacter psychrotolerans]|uniref:CubicO group peptidase (Beta-lactamase class C family) n=1 Tax=Pedobacter psychrotolerans TaxID=1843235 RepID=A0A4V2RZ27_9SPHI|nr:serine hydrolase domain-containing protein [Pedobacter psychrotolerans]TCO23586.1 CubicO group peptidase (beta-lactamase class C family) [Pedobacter psychrotolerans]GGE60971.1 serine hydrolase [Pedobacter psychrotolerans]
MKRILSLLILTVITFSISKAQNFEFKVDSLLTQIFKDKNGPGGVFMVAKNGKPIYKKAFGHANIELGVKMQTQNVFQLGSMTKQFTAIAILILVEQGKIDLQKPISTYIPDYPMGDKITIHQLLTHTSGIKDFTKMKSLNQIAQQNLSPKQMVDFFKNEPVDFNPGEKFEYNNSGYVILGYIIELVSGDTYENYINKNIFEKIGMKHSRYASDVAVIKDRAYGYQQKTSGYVNKTAISFSIPFSSGALMSTVDDMLLWQNALNGQLLLKSETIKKAFTRYKLNNGEAFTYGYGWHLKDIDGIPTREHGGSVFGFKTMGVYIPDQDIYVLGLSNCDCNSPTQVVKDIAELALKTFIKN